MRYVPSHIMKGSGMHYEGIADSVSWTVRDGVLEKRFRGTPPGRVLDLGCGNGENLRLFGALGATALHGVDLDNYLVPDLASRVDFRVCDLNHNPLPWADGSMDVVTALQVLEHLENPFHMMREVHRVLAPGGTFIITVPNTRNIVFRWKFLLTGDMPPWTATNNHLLFLSEAVFKKTYLSLFSLSETAYQRGDVPFGRLWKPFMRGKKHLRVLPPSRLFGKRACYFLVKKT